MKKDFKESVFDMLSKGIAKYGTQKEFARAAGLGEANITRWKNQDRLPSMKELANLMNFMGAELVLPEDSLKDGEALHEYALIPKTTAKAGAGSSFEVEDEMAGLYAFRADYLGLRHISEKKSVLVEVSGDSMEPTLRSGDTILVDKSDREVMDGHIYLVGFQGQLLVKRVSRTVTGLRLKSDNPVFADIDIPKEYADDCVIFGRMRWMCRDS